MELLIEIIIELYCELMLLVVPEEKACSKKYRRIAIFAAIAGLACTFALFIWGCVLWIDHHNQLGAIPIALSVAISVAQITAGMILYRKKSRE